MTDKHIPSTRPPHEPILDSEAPVTRFRYDEETRILFAWWRKPKGPTQRGGGGEICYAYFGVDSRVVERLRAINVTKAFKENAISKGVDAVQSVGTYFNTKIKKYPTLNVTKTKAADLIAEAARIKKEVPTRSTKKVKAAVSSDVKGGLVPSKTKKTTKADIEKVVAEGIKKGNLDLVGGHDIPSKKIPGVGAADGDILTPIGRRRDDNTFIDGGTVPFRSPTYPSTLPTNRGCR